MMDWSKCGRRSLVASSPPSADTRCFLSAFDSVIALPRLKSPTWLCRLTMRCCARARSIASCASGASLTALPARLLLSSWATQRLRCAPDSTPSGNRDKSALFPSFCRFHADLSFYLCVDLCRLLVSTSLDGSCRVWNAENFDAAPAIVTAQRHESRRFARPSKFLSNFIVVCACFAHSSLSNSLPPEFLCVAFHPAGVEFAVGNNDYCARVYDTKTRRLLATLVGHK